MKRLNFKDFTVFFILFVFCMILAAVSCRAQMIKNFPNSAFVDPNTYFLTQEFQGGTSWSLAQKTPFNQIVDALGTFSTHVYNKYGTKIFSNDSICIDTALIINKRKFDSALTSLFTPSFQQVTDIGNVTTDSIIVKNLEVKGNSYQGGWIGLDSQSSSPLNGIHQLRLFMGSQGNLGLVGSRGFASYLNISRITASRSYVLPDRNITIDSLTTSTQTSNGYCKGTSGVLSFITSIPNADLLYSSIFLNGTNVSLGGTFNVTDANLSISDITTNNSSTSQHGFLKKLTGTSTQYMDGSGNWSTPSGTGTVTSIGTSAPITGGTITSTGTIGLDLTYNYAWTGTHSFTKGITCYSLTPNPSTPASGFTLFSDASNKFSWKGQNGYVRTFDGTSNTADRSYILPNVGGTMALIDGGQTITSATWNGTTIAVANGGTSVTTQTSINTTPISYGSNNTITAVPTSSYQVQTVTVNAPSSPYVISSSNANVNSPYNIIITNLGVAMTFSSPTGSWIIGQPFYFIITDDGTGRLLTFNSNFHYTTALPTTTTASKTMVIQGVYLSASNWLITGWGNSN